MFTKFLFRNVAKPTARKKLLTLIDDQIQHDFLAYKYDKNVVLFLQMTGFELEDEETSKFVYLRKKIGKFDLEINFEAQYQMNLSNIEGLKIEATQEKVKSYADFNLFVTNTENNSGIFADCSTCNSNLIYHHIVHSENMSIFKDPIASSKQFLGREFEKLKRPYVEHLIQYLNEFGVDPDVLNFIEIYSADKEFRLYMAWLVKIKEFLKKKL